MGSPRAATLPAVALVVAAVAGCAGHSTARPAVTSVPSPAVPTPTVAASPSPSYDPALAGHIDSLLTTKRTGWDGNGTYVAGKDIRPGWWQTDGGNCFYTAPGTGTTARIPAFTISGGGWSPMAQNVELKPGDKLTIEIEPWLGGGHGCWWNWYNGRQ
jgi:hypothetical protein